MDAAPHQVIENCAGATDRAPQMGVFLLCIFERRIYMRIRLPTTIEAFL